MLDDLRLVSLDICGSFVRAAPFFTIRKIRPQCSSALELSLEHLIPQKRR